jgi:hypothetical protein
MSLTITLKPETETKLKNLSNARGCDVDDFIEKLIEDESNKLRSIDEIFAPFRKNIEESGISEEDLDVLFLQARKEVYAEKKARLKR